MATRHHRSLSFPPQVSHHRNHHRHPRFITVKVEASISIYDGATEESLFIADTVITIPIRVYHRHDRRPHEIDFYRMATSFIWEKLVTINALFSSQRASLLRSMATELSTILESISFLLPLQQHQRDVNMIMYAQLYEYHRSSTSLRHEVFVSSILEDGNLHYHTFNIEPLHEFGIQEVRLFDEEDEYQYIPKPADPQAIENLERINAADWLSTSSSSDQDEQYCNSCSICLEKLVGEDINEDDAQAEDPTEVLELIKMPCNHLFHEGCILGWLMNNHVCPLCRYEIPAASTQENIPSSS